MKLVQHLPAGKMISVNQVRILAKGALTPFSMDLIILDILATASHYFNIMTIDAEAS